MGWTIVGVVGGIIGLILLLVFIRFLFINYIVSRICSFLSIIASFILAGFLVSKAEYSWGLAIGATIATALSWLFFIGPIVFDTYFDGVEWDSSSNSFTAREGGGFVMNAAGALGVSAALYLWLGQEFRAITFIVPAIMCIVNIVFIIKNR